MMATVGWWRISLRLEMRGRRSGRGGASHNDAGAICAEAAAALAPEWGRVEVRGMRGELAGPGARPHPPYGQRWRPPR